jgi:ATP-dependent DNA helicase RecQ
MKLMRALTRLEECDVVKVEPQGAVRLVAEPGTLSGKVKEASVAQLERHEAELHRIEEIRQYAENLDCRRAYLLSYFGDDAAANCRNCDNCQGEGTERAQLIAETRLRTAED